MIRVLIADDEALVRTGFRLILENEDDMTVVGEAADGLEAVRLSAKLDPDVILLDIRMPHMDGVEATRRLIEAGDRKVLILTTFGLDEYLFDVLQAGASGFLLKDVPPDDLTAAVRAIARGDALIEPRMTRRLLAGLARGGRLQRMRPPAELARLTARELDVLRLVGRGLSNSEIATELFIGETTVKTHVAHVFGKLHLRDRVQAVVYAYEAGLLSETEGEIVTETDDPPGRRA